jgi:hypothetical protein
MVCGHSICFRSNTCGQIHVAEPSEKMSISRADLRCRSRAERIGITEIKIEKGAILLQSGPQSSGKGTSICTFWGKTCSSVQGGALNKTVVNHWFQLLEEIVTKYSIAPDYIFSMDETSMFLDKPMSKTLHIGATETSCQPIAICNENCEIATLIPIILAAGKVFKPTIIFKGEQFQATGDWKNPLDALYISFYPIMSTNLVCSHQVLVLECQKRVTLLVRSARNRSRSILIVKHMNWLMDRCTL